ncbi:MAG: serine/threonine protein kinase [Acidimicrobiia bacterium]
MPTNVDVELPMPGVARIDVHDIAIGSCVGRGASGHVYEVTELASGRALALKVHTPGHATAEQFRTAFDVTQRISHPHLLPILATGTLDDAPCALMPVAATPLASLAAELRKTPDRLLDIARQIGRALTYLHEHGIVHGNVTPNNIVVRSYSPTMLDAALTDPGLGNALVAHAPLPRSGYLLSSIGFAAPEQHNYATVGPRTDVYGLAATLWWCLTDTAPMSGALDHTSLTPEIRRALSDALAPTVGARYQSCGALVAALERAFAPTPTLTTAPRQRRSRWSRTRARCTELVRPTRRRIAAFAAMLLLAGVGVGIFVRHIHTNTRGDSNSAETALRATIPAALQATCGRSPLPPNAQAALQCRDRAQNIAITYVRFSSTSALDTWYTTVTSALATGVPRGECASGVNAHRTWRTHSGADAPSGMLHCSATPTGSTYVWTTTALRTGALAQSSASVQSTWAWWQRVPGPVAQ